MEKKVSHLPGYYERVFPYNLSGEISFFTCSPPNTGKMEHGFLEPVTRLRRGFPYKQSPLTLATPICE